MIIKIFRKDLISEQKSGILLMAIKNNHFGETYMEPVHSRCCVYALEYHIVWVVKYRRKVLYGEIESAAYEAICQKAETFGCHVAEVNGEADHIHVLLQAPPTVCLPGLIQSLKGYSAWMLFRRYPYIKKKLWAGHLWNPSYYIATVSENTEAQIRHYIQSQKEA